MANVQFANLSIRFGEKELLDYKEVVAGAFLRDTYVRRYGRSSYHFFETKIGLADKNDPMSAVIWGRFVKETTLEREQVFSEGALVQDRQVLESAPTAFFVLFLADHRLAFVPETRFAPTISNLESTIRLFVKKEFNLWAKRRYREAKDKDSSYTWGDFYIDHVPPSIALVPLASRENIEAFISRFSKIRSLTVHVVKRNQDMNGGALFEALVAKSEGMGASSSRFIVNGDASNGLDLDNTAKFVTETTRGGYERVALRGEDKYGDTLSGTNEDFKLIAEVDTDELTDEEKVREILENYIANKEAGIIEVSERDRDTLAPILLDLVRTNHE